MTETTALATIEKMPAIEIFKPGALDPILDRIKTEARAEAAKLDISTETNRKALASLAFKVAKSKTFLDKTRKELVGEEKKRLAAIDAEGKRLWEELEELQKEIRQPLTDWENAEKDRVAAHEQTLAALELAASNAGMIHDSVSVEQQIAAVEQYGGRDWQEFERRGAVAVAGALAKLQERKAQIERQEAEAAELARLRAEAAAREQKEREERIAREAAEAERKRQEEIAERQRAALRAEQERIEREKVEAEARAKQAEAEKIAAAERAERERIEAEAKAKRDAEEAEARRVAELERVQREAREAAERAEARRVAEAQEAARKAKESAEKAERDRLAAIEQERRRIAEEQRKEAAEAERRARDRAHRGAINREALQGLCDIGVTLEQGKAIIEAIAKGAIPNVTINY